MTIAMITFCAIVSVFFTGVMIFLFSIKNELSFFFSDSPADSRSENIFIFSPENFQSTKNNSSDSDQSILQKMLPSFFISKNIYKQDLSRCAATQNVDAFSFSPKSTFGL
ncbi:MAG TPA: hypothetical protein VK787_15600 [Puia sp.]|jgi:hypothetical protein|nr:hypothetical protein [Puia sp.]